VDFYCFFLVITSTLLTAAVKQKQDSSKATKFEFSVLYGSSFRLGKISFKDSEIESNSKSGQNYSITAHFFVHRKISIGVFFSDMWTSKESYVLNTNESVTTQMKLQYIGFLANYNMYITKDLLLKAGLSIGEMNLFDATKSAIIKGNSIDYGIHSQLIFRITQHIGATFMGSLMPARLNKLSVENRSSDSIISSGSIDNNNIGKLEIGIGIVILL
jgi:hypothetical protein